MLPLSANRCKLLCITAVAAAAAPHAACLPACLPACQPAPYWRQSERARASTSMSLAAWPRPCLGRPSLSDECVASLDKAAGSCMLQLQLQAERKEHILLIQTTYSTSFRARSLHCHRITSLLCLSPDRLPLAFRSFFLSSYFISLRIS